MRTTHCIAPPTRRTKAHNGVSPYADVCKQNQTKMLSVHNKMSLSTAAS